MSRYDPVFRPWVVIGLIALMYSTAANSQQGLGEGLAPPSLRVAVDEFGVDHISGRPAGFGGMSVSVGTEQSGIARDPGRQRYMHDNHTGTLTKIVINNVTPNNPEELTGLTTGTYIKVDAVGRSEIFRQSGSNYTNAKSTGGSLSCTAITCTYTTLAGTISTFDRTQHNSYFANYPASGATDSAYVNDGLQTQIEKPDGEIISITYQLLPDYNQSIPSAASSSLGWMIKYVFGAKTETDLTDANGYHIRITSTRSVMAINTSVEYCDPTAPDCSGLNNDWPESVMDAEWHYRSPPQGGSYIITSSSSVTNALGHSDSHTAGRSSSPVTQTSERYTSFGGLEYEYQMPGCGYTGGTTPCHYFPNTHKVSTATARGRSIVYTYPMHYSVISPDGRFDVDHITSRLKAFTDNLDRKTRYVYADQWGNDVERLINPDATPTVDAPTGGYTEYEYDARRNITEVRVYPKNGGTPLISSATYPVTCSNIKTCNKPTSVTDEAGITTSYTWHAQSGKLATITKPAVDGVQAQTRYTYAQYTPKVRNSAGNLVNSTPVWRVSQISKCMTMTLNTCVGTADEHLTVFEYNHNNVLPTSVTVKLGDGSLAQTTTTQYDIFGNVEWEDGPRPGSHDRVYFFYDALRRVIAEVDVDPDGPGPLPRPATRTFYDAEGNVTAVRTGLVTATTLAAVNSMAVQTETQTDYDVETDLPVVERLYAAGQLERVTQKSYHSRHNLDCEAQRLNPNTFGTLPASACTPGPAGPDGNDRITKHSYDATDALTVTTSAYGTPRQRNDRVRNYRADNGLLESEEDGKGNTTFYKYDDFNRSWRTVYPIASNGAVESSTDYTQKNYTGARVSSVRLRDGQIVNFLYDEVGRTEEKTGAVSETFEYDNFDQVTSHTNNTTGGSPQTSTLTYNALGWKLSETNAFGSITNEYDSYGRRVRLTWPDNFYVTYDYDINGYPADLLQSIKENGSTVLATFAYDDFGRRTLLTRGNNVVTDYDYDELSRLEYLATDVGGTDDDVAETFSYTVAGQIKSHTLDAENEDYVYNPGPASQIDYTPNALNQLSSVDGVSVGYDGVGNLTSEGGSTYTYNANNLLTSADAGITTSLTYDAENRLFSITKSGTTTRFMYDGLDLIAETDDSGAILRRYVHGPDIDDPLVWYDGSSTSVKRYFYENRQGSIVGVTDQSGAIHTVNAFDEYGNQASGNLGRFRYTGQVWLAEIGLYYYKARLYHPGLGRFMQTDPIGYEDGMNWYAYIGNDPVNGRDPTGKCPYGSGGCYMAFAMGEQMSQPEILEFSENSLPIASAAADTAVDFTPIIGDIKGIVEAIADPTLTNVVAAAVGLVPVVGDSAGVVAKGTVRANKIKGDAFRDEFADLMKAEGRDVQTEVTKQTPFGRRVIDIEVSKDGNVLGGIETKTGSSRYIPSQRAKDEWLRQNGYPVDLVRDP